ncbi:hypothetical protein HPB49_007765 [Dermacentor silvarum]|uniref:Uncharacterized protein n=1 Tax=Dermacentor silvarum TaxID=543639 RepID=A0ACB8DY39_DERSI|nr:hypothetical protein HPB49_007765 [Dermacentor silvarum]
MSLRAVAGITERIRIPNSIRNKIIPLSFPKTWEKTIRRKARAETLGRRLSSKLAIYVDAAEEIANTFTIAAINNVGQAVSSRKISAGSIHEAEQATIALGISATRYSFIISDYMSAIRSYMQVSVGPRASEILSEPAGNVTLIWMPTHSGNGGNGMAHHAARELITREVDACRGPLLGETTPSHSYNEIVTAYREDREPTQNITESTKGFTSIKPVGVWHVAIEAIQGDLGWSPYEEREARSKLSYDGRLHLMDDTRWPIHLRITGIQTHWFKWVKFLRRNIDFLRNQYRESKWTVAVKTQRCLKSRL